MKSCWSLGLRAPTSRVPAVSTAGLSWGPYCDSSNHEISGAAIVLPERVISGYGRKYSPGYKIPLVFDRSELLLTRGGYKNPPLFSTDLEQGGLMPISTDMLT